MGWVWIVTSRYTLVFTALIMEKCYTSKEMLSARLIKPTTVLLKRALLYLEVMLRFLWYSLWPCIAKHTMVAATAGYLFFLALIHFNFSFSEIIIIFCPYLVVGCLLVGSLLPDEVFSTLNCFKFDYIGYK